MGFLVAEKSKNTKNRARRLKIRLHNRTWIKLLLIIQLLLLAYTALEQSPTHLEPAFLASGLATWELGTFEPYRVNPPLPRMIAAIPAIVGGYNWDRRHFDSSRNESPNAPGRRSEFELGNALIRGNGTRTLTLVAYGRLACIPFSLLGAYFAYRWAMELYGNGAGVLAIVLFIFEPNLLATGSLITPDAPCIAFGIIAGYSLWKWLKSPSEKTVILSGVAFGLAMLSKTSWIILFGLWPLIWIIWRRNHRQQSPYPRFWHLGCIFAIGVYLVNLGYLFDGTGTTIGEFSFVSSALTGKETPGEPGNRFDGTLLGKIPVLLPKHYVLGIDIQRKDFEAYPHRSYLRGEWRARGWWYYYLYGLLVKVPCGICGMFAVVVIGRIGGWLRPVSFSDEIALLAPAIAYFALVSSQTGFSIHLRYSYPALAMTLIYVTQAASGLMTLKSVRSVFVAVCCAYTIYGTMRVFPNQLAYFNDFVGGETHGHRHLLGSSLDWGQELSDQINWIKINEPGSILCFSMSPKALAEVLAVSNGISVISRSECDTSEILVLYSADRFYDEENRKGENRTGIKEEIVREFRSGSVLVRCSKK